MCKLLLHLGGVPVLHLISLQPIKWRWVINICLLYVIARYTWLSLFAVILFLSTINKSFYYVSLLIITKLYLSHKFKINWLWYFVTQLFAADKYIYDLPKSSINDTNHTLKYWALSGVGRLLWGRSWLWFNSSGFSGH